MTTVSGGAVFVCRFDDFELDRRTLELRKSGQKVKLAPQPARVLALLAARPGELVSRDEIRRGVWGEETFVVLPEVRAFLSAAQPTPGGTRTVVVPW
jgi:DNA-binding winged helix-turn-helix (wHTH) protein